MFLYVRRREGFLKGGDETSKSGGKRKWERKCSDMKWFEA
jgi:hypothetical protein